MDYDPPKIEPKENTQKSKSYGNNHLIKDLKIIHL